jgi:hypothetical protein
MLAIFRQQHRHEEAMQEAWPRADQIRESRYPFIPGAVRGNDHVWPNRIENLLLHAMNLLFNMEGWAEAS